MQYYVIDSVGKLLKLSDVGEKTMARTETRNGMLTLSIIITPPLLAL